MPDLFWKTEKRLVKDLKFFEKNPRKMSKTQAEQLLQSIKKFNLVEIPVIDQNNRIIAGNMRVTALKKLGRVDEEIEVRVPSRDLTEAEAMEYLVRSNKNIGEWETKLLAEFDQDLLKETGFSDKELEGIFYDKKEEEAKELEFAEELLEEHNYVVLYFDNEIDWLNFCSLVELKRVLALNDHKGWWHPAIGRVMKGAEVVNKLRKG
jgi:ParB-like chromosome segregation protein Spo0J